ncbi:unnamed protein product [Paramecium primaurelia]|uniref:Uncharacterized protein n=1 Tax=Paramecium primaurelia TaxID=5886 RepID=A0A8S1NIJ8_PARPR|nr:unnamed protein product [Paramecium primaurelia]
MTDLDFNNSICNNEQKSTERRIDQFGIIKKITKKGKGCYCQNFRQKKKYKIESPNESSNEYDGWEEEDNYIRKQETRRNQKEVVDLVQYASKLQYVINIAKQELKILEETMYTNHTQKLL